MLWKRDMPTQPKVCLRCPVSKIKKKKIKRNLLREMIFMPKCGKWGLQVCKRQNNEDFACGLYFLRPTLRFSSLVSCHSREVTPSFLPIAYDTCIYCLQYTHENSWSEYRTAFLFQNIHPVYIFCVLICFIT